MINLGNTQNNNLSSSISYSKTFPKYPSVNLSASATHNQNTNTEQINMTLPTIQGSMERIFPFAKKTGAKKGLIQNVNFQYNTNARNSIVTQDSLFFTSKMFDDAKFGATHRIPVSTNFKIAKYFSVTLNGNYEDQWVLETYRQRYDPEAETNNKVVTDTIRGFDRYGEYNVGASIGTTVYGQVNFKEDKKIQAIRHVVRPQVSWNYNPSFEDTNDAYFGEDGFAVEYNRFQGTLAGAPNTNRSQT